MNLFECHIMLAPPTGFKLHVPRSLWLTAAVFPTATFATYPYHTT